MIIGVVDYNAGNLRSVETALKYLDAEYIISPDPEKLLKTDRIIFPGVGEAKAAMEAVRERGLDEGLRSFAASGKYLLGICIGCQIFLESSEERNTECLGLVLGRVKRFPGNMQLKVPHMGWNEVSPRQNHPLFHNIPSGTSFYFVHSYYPEVTEKANELAVTEYGVVFSSGIVQDNIMAVQFHPEKSGEYGIRMLRNFLKMKD